MQPVSSGLQQWHHMQYVKGGTLYPHEVASAADSHALLGGGGGGVGGGLAVVAILCICVLTLRRQACGTLLAVGLCLR